MPSSIRAGLGLLRERDFARLFAAYLITHTGSAMAPIAIAFGVLELTGSTRTGATVIAAPVLAQILILLIGGALADRSSRQRILVRSDLVAAASQGCVAALFLTGTASVALLFGLLFVNGAAFAFHQPAAVGFIPQVVAPQSLQHANALLGAARSAALVLGAALAGILVAGVGVGPAIALDALSFAIAGALVATLEPRSQAIAAPTSLVRDLRLGWREFVRHAWLWTIVLQFTFLIMGIEALFALVGPATARDTLGGPRAWGFLMAALGVGTIAGGLLTLRIRVEHPMRVAVLSTFLWALLPALLSLTTNLALLVCAAFVQGAASQVFGVLWYTTLHTEIRPELLSRVSAYDHLGSIALAPLGVVIAGNLYEEIGATATLRLIVAMIVVPTALVLFVPEVWGLRARRIASQSSNALHAPVGSGPDRA